MQGWRKRMEDAHICHLNLGPNKSTHVFGVFDGHGGKEVSLFVKQHFATELIANKSFNSNLKTALIETFTKMDELLLEPSGKNELKKYNKQSKEEDEIINQKEKGNKSGNSQMDFFNQLFNKQDDIEIAMVTGCTSCVVVIDEKNKKIYCANAGDSRAVICSKKGVALAMSIDHKPELDSEKNRIYKAEGWVSEGRVKGSGYLIFRQS
jgi:serine/threonine protein phosphatase PrpC